MRKLAWTIVILCLWTAAAAGRFQPGQAAGKTPITLTYIANMGVQVGSGDTKVLIDALFDKPNPDYRAPSPETVDGRIGPNQKLLPPINNDTASAQALEVERGKIAETVSNVIGWAKDKNLDLFYGSIANDENYISVTPGARIIKRFEDVKQNVPFWMSPDFKYVRHELKELEITFARCGTVAWFFCVLDDINTWKGEPASWENTRWTGVVEKRDGRWVVVSQHFSFAKND